jgi:hypothetical protein
MAAAAARRGQPMTPSLPSREEPRPAHRVTFASSAPHKQTALPYGRPDQTEQRVRGA